MATGQNLNPINLNTNNLRTPPSRAGSPLGSNPLSSPMPRPTNSTPPPISRPKGALERIDIDKIGGGRLMTEGSYSRSFGTNKDVGLKGQLAKVRKAGIKTTTKNLSKENVKQMHDLIADAISKGSITSGSYISRRDRVDIMRKSRTLAKQSDSGFSLEDRKDLIKIVDEMRRQRREKLLDNDFNNNQNDN